MTSSLPYENATSGKEEQLRGLCLALYAELQRWLSEDELREAHAAITKRLSKPEWSEVVAMVSVIDEAV